MAEASGFQLVEALTDLVRNLFSENGVRAQRLAEEGSYHRSLSDKRKWATLINSKVAKQGFRYDELPNFMNCQPPVGMANREMPSLYQPRVQSSTPKLKEVMWTSRAPVWHSPAPRNEAAPDVDIDLWRVMRAHDTWGEVGKQWLGCLLSSPHLVVRCKQLLGDRWFWPLGESGVSGKVSWPASEVHIAEEVYFKLGSVGGI